MAKTRIICILLSIIAVCSYADQSYLISGHSRRIQIDGFLLEWKTSASKKWDNNRWIWDAVNTPEGIAGYFKSVNKPNCTDWTFKILPQESKDGEALVYKIGKDRIEKNSNAFELDKQLYETSGSIVVEWVIPWNKADLDQSGHYAMRLSGQSICGDTLLPIELYGNKSTQKNPWNGTISRIAIIAVLALIFVYMQRKIRKTKRKS